MRILVLLKYGEHYVADEEFTVGCDTSLYACFELVPNGVLRVPFENLAAVENYQDHEIESFRSRLRALEEGRG